VNIVFDTVVCSKGSFTMALNKTRVANSLKGMLVGDALAVRKVTI
jgi:hypothetical protein